MAGREFRQQVGFQSHGAGAYTLRTANAGLGLLPDGVFSGEDGHGVRSLADGHLGVHERAAHHRSSGQHLVVAFGHAAAEVDELAHGCSHAYEEVGRIFQFLTADGCVALKQRFALHHGLIDRESRSHVLHDGSHVHRDGGRGRHLSTDDGVDELLLATLRILHLQRHHLDASQTRRLLGQQVDGLGLVFLDADVAALHFGGLHEQLQAHDDFVGMLHHQPIVGSDVGFALHGIDDDALSLGRGWRTQFHVRGESGAAHAGDAGLLHAFHDFLGRQFRMGVERFELVAAVNVLFPFVALHLNKNGRLAIAGGVDDGVDFHDRARHRRIDGCRHKASSFGQQRAHLHPVALADDGFGGSTDVLRQGEDSLRGQWRHLRGNFGRQFVLFGVNATYFECTQFHACSSFLTVTAGSGCLVAVSGCSATGFGTGKFTALMAPVGHAATHFLQRRHFCQSM